jgi:hypothetical protein
MPRRQRVCIGGPLDGRYADIIPDGFAWLDGDGRAHRHAGPGRYCYQCVNARWVFAGHGARECECGAFVRPDPATGRALPACPLCGAAAQAAGR